jgi:mannose-6-phosphate isomerase-like protein (cupin superfamily)
VTFFEIRDLVQEQSSTAKRYLEFLRVPALSAGIYVLPAGATDTQRPHKEDEVYYVIRGRARMRVGSEEQAVGPGTIVFVGANVEHRFFNISEQIEVLVFFAPAESS